jgi:hypothetical protein
MDDAQGAIPLTAPEVRRLLRVLTLPAAQQAFHLHWSNWRRRRQAQARRCHYTRRLRHGDPPDNLRL